MRAFVGLGSNVGDRLAYLRGAVTALRDHAAVEIVRASSVYETAPVGPEQPDFLNAVVEVTTHLDARALLAVLKAIENRLGRVPRERWGPREIDLDLLLAGDEVVSDEHLQVPHPRMQERAFVLVPLAELGVWTSEVPQDAAVRLAHPPASLL